MPESRRRTGPGLRWLLAAVCLVAGLVTARLLGASVQDATLVVLTLTLLAAAAYARVTYDLYRQGREQLKGWRSDRRVREAIAMASAARILGEIRDQVGKTTHGPCPEKVRKGEKGLYAESAIARGAAVRSLEECALQVEGEARLAILSALDRVYEFQDLLRRIGATGPESEEAIRRQSAADFEEQAPALMRYLAESRDGMYALRRAALEEARAEGTRQ